MTREAEVKAIFIADDIMMAILTGGVYTDEEVDVEGIRRGEDFVTDAAFDPSTGYLLPCALVRQRGLNPVVNVRSQKIGDEFTAVQQVVEIYYYQHRGHAFIDLAKNRAFDLLEGVRLSDSYPIIWMSETAHYPDVGPVKNSTTLRQEWQVVSIRKKTA